MFSTVFCASNTLQFKANSRCKLLFQGVLNQEEVVQDQPESIEEQKEISAKMKDLESKALIPQTVSVTRTESPVKKRNEMFARIGAAVFYGASSFMIMVVNKQVLTMNKFPSFQVRPFLHF